MDVAVFILIGLLIYLFFWELQFKYTFFFFVLSYITLTLVHTSWRKSQNALTTLVFSSSSSMSPSENTEKISDLRLLEPSLWCPLEYTEPKVLDPEDGPVFPSPLSRRELETSAKLQSKWVWQKARRLYCIKKKVTNEVSIITQPVPWNETF